MDILTPVMAACLMKVTPETIDGSHSTVATRELVACTICDVPECRKPVWFADAVKVYAELNKPLPERKPKRKIGRK